MGRTSLLPSPASPPIVPPADAGIDLHQVKPVEPAILVGVVRRFARVLAGHGTGVP
jgi:hypothetical protein